MHMQTLNYSVQNNKVSDLINWIGEGRIGLPELQRPFVWKSSKVRDLIDSLYRGFPIGYIITWSNPDVRLKDGTKARGKTLMIDGQQRVTALRAAIAGEKVMDKRFEMKRICIAFNPKTEEFATRTAAIARDPAWIDDIAVLFKDDFNPFGFVTKFSSKNGYDVNKVAAVIDSVRMLANNEIGNIQLSHRLSINAVTEVFNRINSKGTVLSSADFIMSKLSADTEHHGDMLRKTVEYFTRLLHDGTALDDITSNDTPFSSSDYYRMVTWAANENSNLYLPEFGDIFHIILNVKFNRGKHSDLISLVSGRDFTTKQYTQAAMDDTYMRLSAGINLVTDRSNFQRFVMILRGMGVVTSDRTKIQGTGVLNFGYALYLLLKQEMHTGLSNSQIENVVRRWILLSILTHRYSGSSETQSEADIKMFRNGDPLAVLTMQEKLNLTDEFWTDMLPKNLVTSSAVTNLWRVFLMSQVRKQSHLWLERDLSLVDALTEEGNVHHIFPRAYLIKHGFGKSEYNQIANYVFLSQPRNLQISDQAPKDYLSNPDIMHYGSAENFSENAIPLSLRTMDYTSYESFLEQRRILMGDSIRRLYYSFALA